MKILLGFVGFLLILGFTLFFFMGKSQRTPESLAETYIAAVENQDRLKIRRISMESTLEAAISEKLAFYSDLSLSDVHIMFVPHPIDSYYGTIIIHAIGKKPNGELINVDDRFQVQKIYSEFFPEKWYLILFPTTKDGFPSPSSIATPSDPYPVALPVTNLTQTAQILGTPTLDRSNLTHRQLTETVQGPRTPTTIPTKIVGTIIYPTPDYNTPDIVVDHKSVGGGMLFGETGPYFDKNYVIENFWITELGNNRYMKIYAGREQHIKETNRGDPNQGIIIVEIKERVSKYDAKTIFNEVYQTPKKAGSIHITDVQGMKLTAQSENGASFIFDIKAGVYVESNGVAITTPPPAR